MKRTIKLKWHFPHPPETVWEYLTNPDLLSQWTKIKDFKSVVGFEFTQQERPQPKRGWDGMMYHRILEVIPNEKLSYTFQAGPEKGVITLDTIVTWRLKPDDNGTTLELEHSGFEGLKNYMTSFIMELGWKNHIIKKLKSALK
jgi:uncharacterized protein YndB with AHSA1/START domain